MEIAEVKTKRVMFEELVEKTIKEFEEETGMSIIEIQVERYRGGASRHGILESITINVLL